MLNLRPPTPPLGGELKLARRWERDDELLSLRKNHAPCKIIIASFFHSQVDETFVLDKRNTLQIPV